MLRTKKELLTLVRARDECSGGGSEKCIICNLRHDCRLDEAGTTAETALRFAAALEGYYRAELLNPGRIDIYSARRVARSLLEEAGVL